jgi:hypothetical protein
MISTIEKPFSYIVPKSFSFQNHYDIEGKEIKVVNEVALNEIIPKGFMATRTGKEIWDGERPTATLYYVEALDEGNPENKVDYRDEVLQWKAPFTSAPLID